MRCFGGLVEVIDRGDFAEGHVLWVAVDADVDRATARRMAESFGRVTESDETDDGRRSFAVLEGRGVGQTAVTGSAESSSGDSGASGSSVTSLPAPDPCALTLEDLLAFASTAPADPLQLAARVRAELKISVLRYAVAINRAIDDPAARVLAGSLVDELRRAREARRARRAVGAVGSASGNYKTGAGTCDSVSRHEPLAPRPFQNPGTGGDPWADVRVVLGEDD